MSTTMPYNAKADIHQWTWYDFNGKKFLCTSGGWRRTGEDGDWEPTNIHLLEYLTCTPKPIATEKMIELLTNGSMKVIKRPF